MKLSHSPPRANAISRSNRRLAATTLLEILALAPELSRAVLATPERAVTLAETLIVYDVEAMRLVRSVRTLEPGTKNWKALQLLCDTFERRIDDAMFSTLLIGIPV